MNAKDKARKLDICPACGVPKPVGCIVCWSCFKHVEKPLKYTNLPFIEWLKLFRCPNAPTIKARKSIGA